MEIKLFRVARKCLKNKLMLNQELIAKIVQIKQENGYTLYDLSKKLDIQISTIERWIKTKRINKVYAKLVAEKLRIV